MTKFIKILLIILTTLSSTAYAMVVTSFDKENNCTKYQVIEENELQTDQNIIVGRKYPYSQWGLILRSLRINFDNQEASFELRSSNIFKLDSTIKKKIKIRGNHKEFNHIIQLVNIEQNYSKFRLLKGLCLDEDNYIKYTISKQESKTTHKH